MCEHRRHPRQEPAAVGQAGGAEQRTLVRVAARREVAERPVGADQATVRAFEDLGGVARVDDDCVLVGVDAVGRPQAREGGCDATESSFRVGAQAAPIGRLVLSVERQIGERAIGGGARGRGVWIACRRRVDDRTPVGAAVAAADALRVAGKFTVVVRADDVHGVGQSGRRINVLVVPALAGARVDGRVVGAGGRARCQLLPAVVGGRERVASSGAGPSIPSPARRAAAAAVWSPLSVRQKLPAVALPDPPLFAVPSTR